MSEPWPLYDLFLDLPHPAASPSCPPPFVIGCPDVARSEAVQKELGEPASIARIARFAFPEHDDQAPPPPPPQQGGAGLNRHDVYVTQGFLSHVFSLQLATGQRVHGHVRRYLPAHREAASRYDVGRRGVRALVVLTRHSAGDFTYSAMLKTIEALSALQAATPKDLQPHPKPQENFLASCHAHHVHLCRVYAQKPDEERKPMLLSVDGLEFGSPKLAGVDFSRLLIPVTLLQPSSSITLTSSMTESPILPLLRCLGVPNTMRLLSALLSERRILLISSSPTRLTTCARAALSMLAQGLLHWQHLFIPVLPPHMFQYLAAPMPYLIGILSTLTPQLNKVQELGEALLIYLDQNALETRGIPTTHIGSKIPDLGRGASFDQMQPNGPETSCSEVLAQDLVELLKSDRRAMSGESAFQNLGETTAKATKAMRSAFGRLKSKYLKNDSFEFEGSESQLSEYSETVTTSTADEVYTEGYQNDIGEEEARVALAAFFLCVYGNMRWYLVPGDVPRLDRERFLQQKRALGEGEGSPMFLLCQNMCQSQMFEQFVKERVEEVRTGAPVTKDSPLFLVCASYHRSNNIDFSVVAVQRVSRQIAQANPSRTVSHANANARRLAMSLTSNKAYEGNQQQAVAQLVEMAHETSSVLVDVMSVVWMRISDSKGMQWKHALFALQILKNLLCHGPLAAISEATDGLDKIRALKTFTDTMRAQNSQQIQVAAGDSYNLLIDRAKLFAIRRVCANKRRDLKSPSQRLLFKDTRLRVSVPFKNMHAALHPNMRRKVSPSGTQAIAPTPSSVAPAAPPAMVEDLLGFFNVEVASPQPPPRQAAVQPAPRQAAVQPAPRQAAVQPAPRQEPAVEDVLGLFDSYAAIASPPPVNPFAAGPPPTLMTSPPPYNQMPAPMMTSPPPQGLAPKPNGAPPPKPSQPSVPYPMFGQNQQPPGQQAAMGQHRAPQQQHNGPVTQPSTMQVQQPSRPFSEQPGSVQRHTPQPMMIPQQATAVPQQQYALVPHGYPNMPPTGPPASRQPGVPQQQPFPPQVQHLAVYQGPPQPRHPMHNSPMQVNPGYPPHQQVPHHAQQGHQPPNMFAAPPQQQQPQQPQRTNISQFDPFSQ